MPSKPMPEPIKQLYGAFNLLRSLGFPADDLHVYFQRGDDSQTQIGMAIVQKDEIKFTIAIDQITRDPDQFSQEWMMWASSINQKKIPEEELIEAYRSSKVWQNRVQIIQGLVDKGIYDPGMKDN